MTNNLIKQIQLGNQIYSLGQSETKQVGVKRGNPFITRIDINGNTYLGGLLRPNEIATTDCLTSQVGSIIATGIPQEYMQESGKLVFFCDNYGILQDSTKVIGPLYATKQLTILTDSYTANNPQEDSLCYPTNNNKTYKLVLYWNENDLTQFAYAKVPLCGSSLGQELCSDLWIQNIVSYIHEQESMVIFYKDGEVCIKLCSIYDGYTDIYGGYGYEGQWDITCVEGIHWINGEQYDILYVGPAYMEVNPVSHYLFNVIGEASTLVTNIPLTWNQDTTPEFTTSSLVQISILDGVGSFNTISLDE